MRVLQVRSLYEYLLVCKEKIELDEADSMKGGASCTVEVLYHMILSRTYNTYVQYIPSRVYTPYSDQPAQARVSISTPVSLPISKVMQAQAQAQTQTKSYCSTDSC